MSSDAEENQKIQEMQILEHNLQALMMQKQAIDLEINELANAKKEVQESSSDIYKMTGQIMIKADKENVLAELEEKNKTLSLRISSIEKQEKLLESKAEELKKEAKQFIGENKKK